jgi:NitT/TauT family transport system ATP-binding protein
MEVNKNTSEKILDFQDVSKIFTESNQHSVQALANISFSLYEGEFMVIVGRSGCGKSTILRLAAGLDKPTTGRVLYRGKLIETASRDRGFVFQSYNVFPWLTVQENISFGLSKIQQRAAKEEISEWLAFTGLTEFANAYPRVLSGGMRQRLALARTMIVKPELLLLDEPFGALDEPTREDMQMLLIKAVAKYGLSVILVTHDVREAIILADIITLMSPRPGRIIKFFRALNSKPRSRYSLYEDSSIELYNSILEAL